MPRVATFCPRCGESIDTEVPDEARRVGRAEVVCPSCKFRFVIAPAAAPGTEEAAPETGPASEGGPSPASPQPTDAGGRDRGQGREEPMPPGPPQPQQEGPRYPEAVVSRPARKGPSGALPARLLSAGLLLFFAAAVGLFYAIVFSNAPLIFAEAMEGPPGTAEIEGMVLTPGREPVGGATVAVLEAVPTGERPGLDTPVVQEVETESDGRYRITNVDPGERWLRIQNDGYRTTFFKTWAMQADDDQPQPDLGVALWEVTLHEGDPDDVRYQTQQVAMLDMILRVFQISGWVAYPASIAAAVGGVFVLVRRGFGLAVTGSVAGMIAVGFLVGGLMALIAMILVLTARREFTPLGKKKEQGPTTE